MSPFLLKNDPKINKLIKQISYKTRKLNDDQNEVNYDQDNRSSYQNKSANKYTKKDFINQRNNQGDQRNNQRDQRNYQRNYQRDPKHQFKQNDNNYNQIDKYSNQSENKTSQNEQSQFNQVEYEDEKVKPNFDYKRYKSLNHQLNEISAQSKRSDKVRSDKYEKFTKQSKHLKVKSEDEANFGSLSNVGMNKRKPWLESEYLEDDPDHMERMEVVTNKKPRNYYLFEIKKAIYEDKKLGVHRALELYREMRLDRKLVNHDFFKMLIKGCSIVGYVDKAFELYKEYEELNPPVINRSIVTSMFNCCANSPDKQLGLKKAKEFYDILNLNGYDFNLINYHCLIRTFGLLGDLDTSFAFLDIVVEKRFHLVVDTFNNLLTAVCSNKPNGLSLATNIIQAMRFLNIKPNINTYNLLFRITRDCHFGTEQELEDQIRRFKYPEGITSEFLKNVLQQQRAHLKKNYIKLLEQKKKNDEKIIELNSLESSDDASPVVYEDKSTELMCLNFLGTNIESVKNQLKIIEVDYDSLKLPENRLKLIGGLEHLLRYMYSDEVKPDIKTVSLLTSIIPKNEEEEIKLLEYVENMKIKMDTDFFNMLIRRANARNQPDVAKKYLSLMSSKRLAPNIQTYGVMAMSCRTSEEINRFIDDMERYGIRPNIVIMNQLIGNAMVKKNFNLVSYLINCLKKYDIKPTVKLAESLVMADELSTERLNKYELEEPNSEAAKKYRLSYLKLKKSIIEYLTEYQKLIDENDILEQYKTDYLPRNEEFHKFKVMMTKVLKEKNRFLAESSIDRLNDQKM